MKFTVFFGDLINGSRPFSTLYQTKGIPRATLLPSSSYSFNKLNLNWLLFLLHFLLRLLLPFSKLWLLPQSFFFYSNKCRLFCRVLGVRELKSNSENYFCKKWKFHKIILEKISNVTLNLELNSMYTRHFICRTTWLLLCYLCVGWNTWNLNYE